MEQSLNYKVILVKEARKLHGYAVSKKKQIMLSAI